MRFDFQELHILNRLLYYFTVDLINTLEWFCGSLVMRIVYYEQTSDVFLEKETLQWFPLNLYILSDSSVMILIKRKGLHYA